jgi:hypothetical protein
MHYRKKHRVTSVRAKRIKPTKILIDNDKIATLKVIFNGFLREYKPGEKELHAKICRVADELLDAQIGLPTWEG